MQQWPSLHQLNTNRLALKRAHSASGEEAIPKRSVFGESAYADILYQVVNEFAGRMLACADAREVSHLQRFEGVRQFDRFGRPLGVAYHLRLRAKLVEADVYGPASAAGQAPRHRRFRLTMQLLREDAVSYIPIWQQLIDQGLPTEVYVPCGMQRDELLHTLVRVLDPWLTFLHRNYGLSRLPRNTNFL